jgi:hypothetical protein
MPHSPARPSTLLFWMDRTHRANISHSPARPPTLILWMDGTQPSQHALFSCKTIHFDLLDGQDTAEPTCPILLQDHPLWSFGWTGHSRANMPYSPTRPSTLIFWMDRTQPSQHTLFSCKTIHSDLLDGRDTAVPTCPLLLQDHPLWSFGWTGHSRANMPHSLARPSTLIFWMDRTQPSQQ